jgi:hypothetical protein
MTRKAHQLFARLERRPADPEFLAIAALSIEDRRRINTALADLVAALGPTFVRNAIAPDRKRDGRRGAALGD